MQTYSRNGLLADARAGTMIFIVALPLFMGIAVATGAPVFSGIISGVVGGIMVAWLGGTPLGVSGPSAGLVTIMAVAISHLGFDQFLVIVALSGFFQLLFGYLKLGTLGYYFPSAAVKGMMASIGIVLMLKQIPYFLGMGAHHPFHLAFHNPDHSNTFTLLFEAGNFFKPGALVISLFSLGLLWLWHRPLVEKTWLNTVPVYLVILLTGLLLNYLFDILLPVLRLDEAQLVHLPVVFSEEDWRGTFHFMDFSQLTNPYTYRMALALALISSLEALLVVEAAQKLAPHLPPPSLNRELKGQGLANFLAGLLGGLPITQVIVLNLANIRNGGKTRLSSVFHGLFLLLFVLLIPQVLNRIPLASLSVILIALGYQLASPSVIRSVYRLGWSQFVPFAVTIIAILFTDIITGVIIGILTGLYFLIREHNKMAFIWKHDQTKGVIIITLGHYISLWSKGSLTQVLQSLPQNASVLIDGSQLRKADIDILNVIRDFRDFTAKQKSIQLEIKELCV